MTNGFTNKDEMKILDAPVHMNSIEERNNEVDEAQSIWIQKVDDNSLRTVDSKKLEKAEQQLAKKAEKKEGTPTPNQNRYKSNEASASQIISSKSTTGTTIEYYSYFLSFLRTLVIVNARLIIL